MAQLCGLDVTSKSEDEFHELDHVPLTVRRRLLLSSNQGHPKSGIARGETKTTTTTPSPSPSPTTLMPNIDIVAKKEDDCCDEQGLFSFSSAFSIRSGTDQQLAQGQSQDSKVLGEATSEVVDSKIPIDSAAVGSCSQNAAYGQDIGVPGNCNSLGRLVNIRVCSQQIAGSEAKDDADRLEKVDGCVRTSSQHQVLSDVVCKVKVKCLDDNLLSSLGDCRNESAGTDVRATKVRNNISTDFSDDLDHIVLKERQRMLIKRKSLMVANPVMEGNSVGLPESLAEPCAGRMKEEIQSVDGGSLVAGIQFNDIYERKASALGRSFTNGSSNGIVAGLSVTASQYSPVVGYCIGAKVTKPRNDMEISDRLCSSKKTSVEINSCEVQDSLPAHMNSMQSSTLQTSVKVKAEPLDGNDMQNIDTNSLGNLSFNIALVKSELESPYEGDRVDHMRLCDRMKLRSSVEDSVWSTSGNSECSRKIVPSALEYSPIMSESAKPIKVNRPRKRKKTATDSVETALEEDAPGLMQVLVEQGISVDEIKLYGETDSDDALDDSFIEDSFSELEAVMSKLFFQRSSSLKFAPIRCTKGSKPSYCLVCLFSLVEQTRYLQFRKWPVEWGWCRDLQSFIFVFERHKRIVLERPEYGYATYFFEVVDSSPISWQIKRLVTAMKLTSCGRVTLIENKALMVGEDLTEGEAQVLKEYGWIPNTGLGTMLNYHDRVVHDRKNEKDTSEWRSKIGKMLMDGYNGGSIVSTTLADKVIECKNTEIPPSWNSN